jgi:tripartite-type tricarboxylate transporter receptor subunit TctC
MSRICARNLLALTAGLVPALVCAAVALAQGTSSASRWPERPIRLIVPFQAGSSSDTIARIVSQKLGERLGQQIVIENKVGGASIVGTDAIARAEPDGYTIGLANTTTHAATTGLGAVLPFDPIKDFTPVAMIGNSPFVLLITPGLAVGSVQELIAVAKSKPGMLNYASAGTGSMTHLAGALFASMAGIQLTHVPYRGTGQSVFDVMEGRIEMVFGTIAPSLSHIRAGKMRALATTGVRRNGMLPELPTLAEAGLPGYEAGLWTAFVLPAGAPAGIVTRLNREVNAAVNSDEVRAALDKQGVETDTGTPEALAAVIHADMEKWRDVVVKAGIRAQ